MWPKAGFSNRLLNPLADVPLLGDQSGVLNPPTQQSSVHSLAQNLNRRIKAELQSVVMLALGSCSNLSLPMATSEASFMLQNFHLAMSATDAAQLLSPWSVSALGSSSVLASVTSRHWTS